MTDDPKLDFSSILASTIHDMKNSLGMVLSSLEQLAPDEAGEAPCSPERIAQLQYEARRVNDNLIQLLTIYKVENQNFGASIAEVPVYDFLEECYLLNGPTFKFRGVEVEIDCDEDLVWYFDRNLMSGLVNNVINNALRYTDDRLRLHAEQTADGYLCLAVEDNGPGFPDAMLAQQHRPEVDFSSGHTGLGLFFTRLVAGLHREGKRRGYIDLHNDGEWGGGRFAVYLP